MAITLSFRKSSRLSCPRHIRFNPDLQGEGAIRGACPGCRAVYEAYRAFLKLEAAGREFDDAIDAAATTLRDVSTIKAA